MGGAGGRVVGVEVWKCGRYRGDGGLLEEFPGGDIVIVCRM